MKKGSKAALVAALREGYQDAAAPGVSGEQMPASAKKVAPPAKKHVAKALRESKL